MTIAKKSTLAAALLLASAAVFQGTPLHAQSLTARIAAAPADASVRFSFAAKPGVCGDGQSISVMRDGETVMTNGRSYRMQDGRAVSLDGECVEGPVRVDLTRSGGVITRARIAVGGRPPSIDSDLGTVSPEDAVAWLLDERTLQSVETRAAGDLVFGATLAPQEVWPQLLRTARNQQLPERVRTSAIFWLAQVAGERASEGLTSVIGDDSDEMEVRKHAVFALSQIRGDSSVDALIDLARTTREPEIRRTAIFWLGQSKSPRAIAFFEEILRG